MFFRKNCHEREIDAQGRDFAAVSQTIERECVFVCERERGREGEIARERRGVCEKVYSVLLCWYETG
jgi:hypothetical protein